jgi:hypothetical protein
MYGASQVPWGARIMALLLAPVVAGEVALALRADQAPGAIGRAATLLINPYVAARRYAVANWVWLVPVVLAALVVLALLARRLLLLWRNVIVARITGAYLAAADDTFEKTSFDLKAELARTPRGKYFIGRDPGGAPVYLTEWDLDTHGHIMGQTGSGKTRSVLEPLMFQDLRAGKGLLFMDAKGSSENVAMLKALARITGRETNLRLKFTGEIAVLARE